MTRDKTCGKNWVTDELQNPDSLIIANTSSFLESGHLEK